MSNENTPPVRTPAADGARTQQRDITGNDERQAPKVPKTSGAPEKGKEPLANPISDRNTEGPREGGVTPRPTDKPIVGGDRG